MALTWNPSDKSSSISLSNGNLTATAAFTGQDCARVTAAFGSGKFYVEFGSFNNGGTAGGIGVGVMNATANINNYLGSDANSIGYYGDGSYAGTGTSGSGGAYSSGTVGMAIDTVAKTVWWTRDGSTWVPGTGANPATATGGYSIAGLGSSFFAACRLYASPAAMTLNAGTTATAFTPPSGFSTVDSPTPSATPAYFTQIGSEAWFAGTPTARVTQTGVEAWTNNVSTARFTQTGLEVWRTVSTVVVAQANPSPRRRNIAVSARKKTSGAAQSAARRRRLEVTSGLVAAFLVPAGHREPNIASHYRKKLAKRGRDIRRDSVMLSAPVQMRHVVARAEMVRGYSARKLLPHRRHDIRRMAAFVGLSPAIEDSRHTANKATIQRYLAAKKSPRRGLDRRRKVGMFVIVPGITYVCVMT